MAVFSLVEPIECFPVIFSSLVAVVVVVVPVITSIKTFYTPRSRFGKLKMQLWDSMC
jgi:hypothetical protein